MQDQNILNYYVTTLYNILYYITIANIKKFTFKHSIYCIIKPNIKHFTFNPIPAGGEINSTPPVVFFLHYSKSIGLRLLQFSVFSLIPIALPFFLKPGFFTNCLNPQAHCLNDYFFL